MNALLRGAGRGAWAYPVEVPVKEPDGPCTVLRQCGEVYRGRSCIRYANSPHTFHRTREGLRWNEYGLWRV